MNVTDATDRSRYRQDFDAYLDDALDPDARREIEEVLSTDDALQRELDSYRTTIALVRGIPREVPPPAFSRLVKKRLEKRLRGRPFGIDPWTSFRVELATCVLLIIAVAAVWVLSIPNLATPNIDLRPSRVPLAASDRAAFETVGTIELIGTEQKGTGLVVSLLMAADREGELVDLLAKNPHMHVILTSIVRKDGLLRLKLRVPVDSKAAGSPP